jgi:DNA processing protein
VTDGGRGWARADAIPKSVVRGAERDAWAVLASVNGLGPVGLGRLLRRHGSAAAVLEVASRPDGPAALCAAALAPPDTASDPVFGDGSRRIALDPVIAAGIASAARDRDRLLDEVHRLGLEIVILDDEDYPPLLLALEAPPPVVFVRGSRAILSVPGAVAVVGTRHPTEAGRHLARRLGAAIAAVGGVVVSGLALGIDGAAHSGVVDAGSPTIAVLGSGHAALYPRAHAPLADAIVAAGGAVISELAPAVNGNRGTFPRRNRVISGLSRATVVVEAPLRSGALITAHWALEQGRECFVVPGTIGSRESAGCLDLLWRFHGQARIVATLAGLLDDLGFLTDVQVPAGESMLPLGTTERTLAALVAAGHTTVDALAGASGLAVSSVLSALTLLEMRGLVTAAYGRYRARGELVPVVITRRKSVPARAIPS